MKSYTMYEGPSLIDGGPIFAALTGVHRPSANSKTGPVIQQYILRADTHPFEAVKTGADESICGKCPLRGDGHGKARSCYVTLFQGLGQVYRVKDALVPIKKHLYRNRIVRFGAYGDPAALPIALTADVHKHAALTLGYTHQWRTCDPDLRHYLMASCDSEEDRDLAKQAGWATFRVKDKDAPKRAGEMTCPASEEAGHKLNCASCGTCTGGETRDVVINVHGAGRKHFASL